ncbi:hypothetical protein EVAR_9667_1 [Eumeta japonica]|uniref:Uncharacterized protein n=1 Tax=Eumeta variegata TaxID=151549 RepID=A0A4C1TJW4_EUMVA|nr:hypothetical protein EVAR_9667_1 [Eumeta japonica]
MIELQATNERQPISFHASILWLGDQPKNQKITMPHQSELTNEFSTYVKQEEFVVCLRAHVKLPAWNPDFVMQWWSWSLTDQQDPHLTSVLK